MKKNIAVLSISLLCSFSIFAQQMVPDIIKPKIESPRVAGLGTPFTTFEAGVDTLFTNPALFAFLNRRWSAGKVAVSMTVDAFSLLEVASKQDKYAGFTDSVFERTEKHIGFSLTGPFALAITGKNFGAGIFNRTIIAADVNSGIAERIAIGEELFLTGGYGGTVFDDGSNSISLGIQMKGFFQTFSYALTASRTYLKNAENDKFKDLNIVLVNGIGIDAGFLYKHENIFSFGITCSDAYTAAFCTPYSNLEGYKKTRPSGKTQYKYVLPNLSVGIGTMPVNGDIWKTVSTWAFYIDYRNVLAAVFNKQRNALLNLAAGTEIVFHKVLSFRLGLNECYPHFGCGLDFTYFKFDIAASIDEAGNKLWEKPLIKLDCALSFEY